MIKALVGTLALVLLNNLGLVLMIRTHGFLNIIGYIDYMITFLFMFFIVTKYMESDFYKNL